MRNVKYTYQFFVNRFFDKKNISKYSGIINNIAIFPNNTRRSTFANVYLHKRLSFSLTQETCFRILTTIFGKCQVSPESWEEWEIKMWLSTHSLFIFFHRGNGTKENAVKFKDFASCVSRGGNFQGFRAIFSSRNLLSSWVYPPQPSAALRDSKKRHPCNLAVKNLSVHFSHLACDISSSAPSTRFSLFLVGLHKTNAFKFLPPHQFLILVDENSKTDKFLPYSKRWFIINSLYYQIWLTVIPKLALI